MKALSMSSDTWVHDNLQAKLKWHDSQIVATETISLITCEGLTSQLWHEITTAKQGPGFLVNNGL